MFDKIKFILKYNKEQRFEIEDGLNHLAPHSRDFSRELGASFL